jgi:hypothetical protein
MSKLKILLLLLFFPIFIHATDLIPWFGNIYEAELRTEILYQNYQSISSGHHTYKKNANDYFLTLSVEYPFKRFSGQFEATGAHTHRQQPYRLDNVRVTGRYQWTDQLEGDPFNIVSGVIVDFPLTHAVHDVSSSHHGHLEGELNVAFGKKYGYPGTRNYHFRWWSVIGIGLAEEGSPWVRDDAALEFNFANRHHLRAFVNTLWGLGRDDLRLPEFRGYGSIRHQSVDVGFRYSFDAGCYGTLSIQYARRVYAFNFPEKTNLVMLEYYISFGMQAMCSYPCSYPFSY